MNMSDIPSFYSIGAYDPWTGSGKPKWRTEWTDRTDKSTRTSFQIPWSGMENDDRIIEILFGIEPGHDRLFSPTLGLQLVLGILPKGDYATLVPSFRANELRSIGFLPSKHYANEFLSLSPMYFREKAELAVALKEGKERRANHHGQANARGSWDTEPNANARKLAAFEHARVFYTSYFRGFRPHELGIPAMFSHTEPKIVVLQFNFFQPRVLAEDMEDLLLDAAWGVVDFPSRSIDDIIHFSVNGALNNPGRPPRPVYGKEEVELAYGEKKKETIRVSAPQLANHLRRLLLSLDPNADIVFLTHDVYNLSRAFCHLGLQDLYPQAATTKNNWRLYYGILNSSNDWEGIGALVGYPERVPIQQKGNTAMKPDPGRSSTASDASRASSRYDSREPSTTPSSRYGSASPMPDSRMSRDTTLVPGTQSRGSSIYSDRYDERSNREYSRGVSTKQEPYENERDRSRSQLFRPRSRSPSSRPSSSVSSRYTSATSVPPVQGEEEKFAPLGQELFVPLKHELPLKNPIKNEDEKKPFVGQTPTGGFAGAPRRTFVLDTQVLYGTSARTWSDLHPLHTVAVAMGLREEDQGICAAYELVDIWDIASRLLSGPPVLFIKGFIDEDVKVKKAEEEYYKLEEQGPPPEDTQSTSHQGGMFGVPYSKPKRDFYDVVFEDDDDDY